MVLLFIPFPVPFSVLDTNVFSSGLYLPYTNSGLAMYFLNTVDTSKLRVPLLNLFILTFNDSFYCL